VDIDKSLRTQYLVVYMMSARHLVIVESPAKAKTIERYLGSGYRVLASYGHVRDLPEHTLGVDVDHGYRPSYVVPKKAVTVVSALKQAAKAASDIYLATDYDREGEAIAWHVTEALGLRHSKAAIPIHRITFHEITQSAIQAAIEHPRAIDEHLVDAQQARRVLDRLVGYTLSPFLWKKVMKGLSAGRVQSVAVRLIVDRERAIRAFTPQEYWSVLATVATGQGNELVATLVAFDGEPIEKLTIGTADRATELQSLIEAASFRVHSVESKDAQKRPSPPFTTSTLQQTASHRLGLSAKATMKLAQDLYEAGYITYMRTDSTSLATEAVSAARTFIERQFGREYRPEQPVHYATKSKGAQEAHEAIRPTDPSKRAGALQLPSDRHERLYELIWQRMVACQMSPAKVTATVVTIKADRATFRVTGSVIKFPGYLKVWPTESKDTLLPALAADEPLTLRSLATEQHFTEPPPRYSEATLVKALEEHGIGRPSTYAPTLSTIIDRGYVELIDRRFHPTQIGEVVTTLLVEHFPSIVDLAFTAEMEEKLDQVAEGKQDWATLLDQFYRPYAATLSAKQEIVEKQDLTEPTDKVCPACSKPMVIRPGRFGKFLACTGFPACRHTEPIVVDTGIECPQCHQGTLAQRKTRRGKPFWGCRRYPECQFATWDDPAKTPPVYDPNAPKKKPKARTSGSTRRGRATGRRTKRPVRSASR
jgi:DNA topoisomerase-1